MESELELAKGNLRKIHLKNSCVIMASQNDWDHTSHQYLVI